MQVVLTRPGEGCDIHCPTGAASAAAVYRNESNYEFIIMGLITVFWMFPGFPIE